MPKLESGYYEQLAGQAALITYHVAMSAMSTMSGSSWRRFEE